jgi:hypothetical protein
MIFFFKFAPAGKSLRTVEYYIIGGVTVLLLLLLLLHPLFVKKTYCVNTYFVNVTFASYNLKVCHRRQT